MGTVIGFVVFGLFTGLIGFVWGYCKGADSMLPEMKSDSEDYQRTPRGP